MRFVILILLMTGCTAKPAKFKVGDRIQKEMKTWAPPVSLTYCSPVESVHHKESFGMSFTDYYTESGVFIAEDDAGACQ